MGEPDVFGDVHDNNEGDGDLGEFDIYGNLDEIQNDERHKQLERDNQTMLDRIKSLQDEVERLQIKLQEKTNTEATLKTNISSLYNTAKAEIARKDRNIAELRVQVEDYAFKRNNGKCNKCNVARKDNTHAISKKSEPPVIDITNEETEPVSYNEGVYKPEDIFKRSLQNRQRTEEPNAKGPSRETDGHYRNYQRDGGHIRMESRDIETYSSRREEVNDAATRRYSRRYEYNEKSRTSRDYKSKSRSPGYYRSKSRHRHQSKNRSSNERYKGRNKSTSRNYRSRSRSYDEFDVRTNRTRYSRSRSRSNDYDGRSKRSQSQSGKSCSSTIGDDSDYKFTKVRDEIELGSGTTKNDYGSKRSNSTNIQYNTLLDSGSSDQLISNDCKSPTILATETTDNVKSTVELESQTLSKELIDNWYLMKMESPAKSSNFKNYSKVDQLRDSCQNSETTGDTLSELGRSENKDPRLKIQSKPIQEITSKSSTDNIERMKSLEINNILDYEYSRSITIESNDTDGPYTTKTDTSKNRDPRRRSRSDLKDTQVITSSTDTVEQRKMHEINFGNSLTIDKESEDHDEPIFAPTEPGFSTRTEPSTVNDGESAGYQSKSGTTYKDGTIKIGQEINDQLSKKDDQTRKADDQTRKTDDQTRKNDDQATNKEATTKPIDDQLNNKVLENNDQHLSRYKEDQLKTEGDLLRNKDQARNKDEDAKVLLQSNQSSKTNNSIKNTSAKGGDRSSIRKNRTKKKEAEKNSIHLYLFDTEFKSDLTRKTNVSNNKTDRTSNKTETSDNHTKNTTETVEDCSTEATSSQTNHGTRKVESKTPVVDIKEDDKEKSSRRKSTNRRDGSKSRDDDKRRTTSKKRHNSSNRREKDSIRNSPTNGRHTKLNDDQKITSKNFDDDKLPSESVDQEEEKPCLEPSNSSLKRLGESDDQRMISKDLNDLKLPMSNSKDVGQTLNNSNEVTQSLNPSSTVNIDLGTFSDDQNKGKPDKNDDLKMISKDIINQKLLICNSKDVGQNLNNLNEQMHATNPSAIVCNEYQRLSDHDKLPTSNLEDIRIKNNSSRSSNSSVTVSIDLERISGGQNKSTNDKSDDQKMGSKDNGQKLPICNSEGVGQSLNNTNETIHSTHSNKLMTTDVTHINDYQTTKLSDAKSNELQVKTTNLQDVDLNLHNTTTNTNQVLLNPSLVHLEINKLQTSNTCASIGQNLNQHKKKVPRLRSRPRIRRIVMVDGENKKTILLGGGNKSSIVKSEPPIVNNSELPITNNSEQPIINKAEPSIITASKPPIINKSEAPIINNSEAPIINNSKSPIINNSEAPIINNSEPPIINNSKLPIIINSEAPIINNSEAPIINNSEAPIINNTEPPIINNAVPSVISTVEPSIISTVEPSIISRSEHLIINNSQPSESQCPSIISNPQPSNITNMPLLLPTPMETPTKNHVSSYAIVTPNQSPHAVTFKIYRSRSKRNRRVVVSRNWSVDSTNVATSKLLQNQSPSVSQESPKIHSSSTSIELSSNSAKLSKVTDVLQVESEGLSAEDVASKVKTDKPAVLEGLSSNDQHGVISKASGREDTGIFEEVAAGSSKNQHGVTSKASQEASQYMISKVLSSEVSQKEDKNVLHENICDEFTSKVHEDRSPKCLEKDKPDLDLGIKRLHSKQLEEESKSEVFSSKQNENHVPNSNKSTLSEVKKSNHIDDGSQRILSDEATSREISLKNHENATKIPHNVSPVETTRDFEATKVSNIQKNNHSSEEEITRNSEEDTKVSDLQQNVSKIPQAISPEESTEQPSPECLEAALEISSDEETSVGSDTTSTTMIPKVQRNVTSKGSDVICLGEQTSRGSDNKSQNLFTKVEENVTVKASPASHEETSIASKSKSLTFENLFSKIQDVSSKGPSHEETSAASKSKSFTFENLFPKIQENKASSHEETSITSRSKSLTFENLFSKVKEDVTYKDPEEILPKRDSHIEAKSSQTLLSRFLKDVTSKKQREDVPDITSIDADSITSPIQKNGNSKDSNENSTDEETSIQSDSTSNSPNLKSKVQTTSNSLDKVESDEETSIDSDTTSTTSPNVITKDQKITSKDARVISSDEETSADSDIKSTTSLSKLEESLSTKVLGAISSSEEETTDSDNKSTTSRNLFPNFQENVTSDNPKVLGEISSSEEETSGDSNIEMVSSLNILLQVQENITSKVFGEISSDGETSDSDIEASQNLLVKENATPKNPIETSISSEEETSGDSDIGCKSSQDLFSKIQGNVIKCSEDKMHEDLKKIDEESEFVNTTVLSGAQASKVILQTYKSSGQLVEVTNATSKHCITSGHPSNSSIEEAVNVDQQKSAENMILDAPTCTNSLPSESSSNNPMQEEDVENQSKSVTLKNSTCNDVSNSGGPSNSSVEEENVYQPKSVDNLILNTPTRTNSLTNNHVTLVSSSIASIEEEKNVEHQSKSVENITVRKPSSNAVSKSGSSYDNLMEEENVEQTDSTDGVTLNTEFRTNTITKDLVTSGSSSNIPMEEEENVEHQSKSVQNNTVVLQPNSSVVEPTSVDDITLNTPTYTNILKYHAISVSTNRAIEEEENVVHELKSITENKPTVNDISKADPSISSVEEEKNVEPPKSVDNLILNAPTYTNILEYRVTSISASSSAKEGEENVENQSKLVQNVTGTTSISSEEKEHVGQSKSVDNVTLNTPTCTNSKMEDLVISGSLSNISIEEDEKVEHQSKSVQNETLRKPTSSDVSNSISPLNNAVEEKENVDQPKVLEPRTCTNNVTKDHITSGSTVNSSMEEEEHVEHQSKLLQNVTLRKPTSSDVSNSISPLNNAVEEEEENVDQTKVLEPPICTNNETKDHITSGSTVNSLMEEEEHVEHQSKLLQNVTLRKPTSSDVSNSISPLNNAVEEEENVDQPNVLEPPTCTNNVIKDHITSGSTVNSSMEEEEHVEHQLKSVQNITPQRKPTPIDLSKPVSSSNCAEEEEENVDQPVMNLSVDSTKSASNNLATLGSATNISMEEEDNVVGQPILAQNLNTSAAITEIDDKDYSDSDDETSSSSSSSCSSTYEDGLTSKYVGISDSSFNSSLQLITPNESSADEMDEETASMAEGKLVVDVDGDESNRKIFEGDDEMMRRNDSSESSKTVENILGGESKLSPVEDSTCQMVGVEDGMERNELDSTASSRIGEGRKLVVQPKFVQVDLKSADAHGSSCQIVKASSIVDVMLNPDSSATLPPRDEEMQLEMLKRNRSNSSASSTTGCEDILDNQSKLPRNDVVTPLVAIGRDESSSQMMKTSSILQEGLMESNVNAGKSGEISLNTGMVLVLNEQSLAQNQVILKSIHTQNKSLKEKMVFQKQEMLKYFKRISSGNAQLPSDNDQILSDIGISVNQQMSSKPEQTSSDNERTTDNQQISSNDEQTVYDQKVSLDNEQVSPNMAQYSLVNEITTPDKELTSSGNEQTTAINNISSGNDQFSLLHDQRTLENLPTALQNCQLPSQVERNQLNNTLPQELTLLKNIPLPPQPNNILQDQQPPSELPEYDEESLVIDEILSAPTSTVSKQLLRDPEETSTAINNLLTAMDPPKFNPLDTVPPSPGYETFAASQSFDEETCKAVDSLLSLSTASVFRNSPGTPDGHITQYIRVPPKVVRTLVPNVAVKRGRPRTKPIKVKAPVVAKSVKKATSTPVPRNFKKAKEEMPAWAKPLRRSKSLYQETQPLEDREDNLNGAASKDGVEALVNVSKPMRGSTARRGRSQSTCQPLDGDKTKLDEDLEATTKQFIGPRGSTTTEKQLNNTETTGRRRVRSKSSYVAIQSVEDETEIKAEVADLEETAPSKIIRGRSKTATRKQSSSTPVSRMRSKSSFVERQPFEVEEAKMKIENCDSKDGSEIISGRSKTTTPKQLKISDFLGPRGRNNLLMINQSNKPTVQQEDTKDIEGNQSMYRRSESSVGDRLKNLEGNDEVADGVSPQIQMEDVTSSQKKGRSKSSKRKRSNVTKKSEENDDTHEAIEPISSSLEQPTCLRTSRRKSTFVDHNLLDEEEKTGESLPIGRRMTRSRAESVAQVKEEVQPELTNKQVLSEPIKSSVDVKPKRVVNSRRKLVLGSPMTTGPQVAKKTVLRKRGKSVASAKRISGGAMEKGINQVTKEDHQEQSDLQTEAHEGRSQAISDKLVEGSGSVIQATPNRQVQSGSKRRRVQSVPKRRVQVASKKEVLPALHIQVQSPTTTQETPGELESSSNKLMETLNNQVQSISSNEVQSFTNNEVEASSNYSTPSSKNQVPARSKRTLPSSNSRTVYNRKVKSPRIVESIVTPNQEIIEATPNSNFKCLLRNEEIGGPSVLNSLQPTPVQDFKIANSNTKSEVVETQNSNPESPTEKMGVTTLKIPDSTPSSNPETIEVGIQSKTSEVQSIIPATPILRRSPIKRRSGVAVRIEPIVSTNKKTEVSEYSPDETTKCRTDEVTKSKTNELTESGIDEFKNAGHDGEVSKIAATKSTSSKFIRTSDGKSTISSVRKYKIIMSTPNVVTKSGDDELTASRNDEITKSRPDLITEFRPTEFTKYGSDEVIEARSDTVSESKFDVATESISDGVITKCGQEESRYSSNDVATSKRRQSVTINGPEEVTPSKSQLTSNSKITPREATKVDLSGNDYEVLITSNIQAIATKESKEISKPARKKRKRRSGQGVRCIWSTDEDEIEINADVDAEQRKVFPKRKKGDITKSASPNLCTSTDTTDDEEIRASTVILANTYKSSNSTPELDNMSESCSKPDDLLENASQVNTSEDLLVNPSPNNKSTSRLTNNSKDFILYSAGEHIANTSQSSSKVLESNSDLAKNWTVPLKVPLTGYSKGVLEDQLHAKPSENAQKAVPTISGGTSLKISKDFLVHSLESPSTKNISIAKSPIKQVITDFAASNGYKQSGVDVAKILLEGDVSEELMPKVKSVLKETQPKSCTLMLGRGKMLLTEIISQRQEEGVGVKHKGDDSVKRKRDVEVGSIGAKRCKKMGFGEVGRDNELDVQTTENKEIINTFEVLKEKIGGVETIAVKSDGTSKAVVTKTWRNSRGRRCVVKLE